MSSAVSTTSEDEVNGGRGIGSSSDSTEIGTETDIRTRRRARASLTSSSTSSTPISPSVEEEREEGEAPSSIHRLTRMASNNVERISRPGSNHARPHQDLRLASSRSLIRPEVFYQSRSQDRSDDSSAEQTRESVGGSSSMSEAGEGGQEAPSFPPPSVATQIASLHRAAEVARFEWRARYFRNLAERSEREAENKEEQQRQQQRFQRRQRRGPMHIDLATEQDTARSTGVGIIDISEDDDDANDDDNDASSTASSNDTEEAVVAHTMRSTVERRREQHPIASNTSTPLPAFMSPFSPNLAYSTNNPDHNRIRREADDLLVWDRMVNDLAVGAGVHPGGGHAVGSRPVSVSGSSGFGDASNSDIREGRSRIWDPEFPWNLDSRITSGIAASMLALSASAPRSDANGGSGGRGSTSSSFSHWSRRLPHPIWARRYPGAAGEWLRSELARRSDVSRNQQQPSQLAREMRSRAAVRSDSASATPPTHSTPAQEFSGSIASSLNAQTNIGTHSEDTIRSLRQDRGAQEDTPASLQNVPDPITENVDNNSINMTGVSNAPHVSVQDSLQEPTVDARPMSNDTEMLGTAEQRSIVNAARQEGADTIARMAQALRERNAALSARGETLGQSSDTASAVQASNASRATRGGLDYIRRLRHLDGLEERSNDDDAALSSSDNVGARRQEHLQDEEHPMDPNARPRPFEVFPWYHPPPHHHSTSHRAQSQEFTSNGLDPDGDANDWYTAARARIEAQHQARAAQENNDPDGELYLSDVDDSDEETVSERTQRGASTSNVDDPSRVRRVPSYRSSEAQAQRRRNRAALVVSDGLPATESSSTGQASGPTTTSSVMGAVNARAAAEGWTLIEQRPQSPPQRTTSEDTGLADAEASTQRPSTPLRQTADEGSNYVTTWYRDPAQPSRWLSTSPGPMNRPSLPPPAQSRSPIASSPGMTSERGRLSVPQRRSELYPSGQRVEATASDDPRTTRRPRRLASLNDDAVRRFESLLNQQSPSLPAHPAEGGGADTSTNGTTSTSRVRERQTSSPRPIPRHYTRQRHDEFWGRSTREDTPPPEDSRDGPGDGNTEQSGILASTTAQLALLQQRTEASLRQTRRLTDMGARLEQEFRARQDELRVREERLRLEVARRRAQVDALRQREGRIGRVLLGRIEANSEAERTRQQVEEREPLLGTFNSSNDIEEARPGNSSTSLVRRRSLRDSGLTSVTRSYMRLLRQSRHLSSAFTNPILEQVPRRRRAKSSSFVETDKSAEAMGGLSLAPPRPGACDDLVLSADKATLPLRSSRHFAPLLSTEDRNKLGESGIALMRLVDEAASSTVKKLVTHAKLKKLALQWTPMQPDLPDTLEDGAVYPLRFQARVLRGESNADNNGSRINSAQCILAKDESGLVCDAASQDAVVLRFLAAVLGRAESSSVTSSLSPASADSGHNAQERLASSYHVAYDNEMQRRLESRAEERDWGRARDRIIGQANDVDSRRAALGLPPRSSAAPPSSSFTLTRTSTTTPVEADLQQPERRDSQLHHDNSHVTAAMMRDDTETLVNAVGEDCSWVDGGSGVEQNVQLVANDGQHVQSSTVALTPDQWRLIEHVKARALSRLDFTRRHSCEHGRDDILKASDFVPIVCGNIGMAGRLLVEDRALSLARAQTKREEEAERQARPQGMTAKENVFSLSQLDIQIEVPRSRWSSHSGSGSGSASGPGWATKAPSKVRGLVFVESTNERLEQRLSAFKSIRTFDDFEKLATSLHWGANDVDGIDIMQVEKKTRRSKVAKAPWRTKTSLDDAEDDQSLGDPFAVERMATKECKDKGKSRACGCDDIEMAPPAALFETDARGRATIFAEGNEGGGLLGRKRYEGSYIGITFLHTKSESNVNVQNVNHDNDDGKCKVLWIEAFGKAGRRTFGAASLR